MVMGKWLSKDPDAYLPDRPPLVQPYLERAREHALRHDGPPYAEHWRRVQPRWRVILVFVAGWYLVGYAAAYVAGMSLTLDTAVVAVVLSSLSRPDALHFNGAAMHERRDYPTWRGRPFGAAPWLAVLALHLFCVFGVAAGTALLTGDEGTQRVAVLAAAILAGAAGWALDLWWGRADRRTSVPKPKQPPTFV